MFFFEVDEHIILRQLQLKDANEMFQIIDTSREYLREWLPWVVTTQTPEDSLAFIDHTLMAHENKKGLTAAIFYQDRFAGLIGFNNLDWANRIAHIGYWLAPNFQGKGIMTSATRALIDYAFRTLDINRVEIRAAYENTKSRSIPERLGFLEEGLIRQSEWLNDHYVDLVVYGMLASDWLDCLQMGRWGISGLKGQGGS